MILILFILSIFLSLFWASKFSKFVTNEFYKYTGFKFSNEFIAAFICWFLWTIILWLIAIINISERSIGGIICFAIYLTEIGIGVLLAFIIAKFCKLFKVKDSTERTIFKITLSLVVFVVTFKICSIILNEFL